MPLIEIHLLPGYDPAVLRRAAQRINAGVSSAIGARRDAVWTTWRTLDGYAVGELAASAQPRDTHAPIVHVYARRTPEEVDKICDVVEAVVVEELGLESGNVFITVQPVYAGPGRA